MLWPSAIPQLSREELAGFASLSYPELCAVMLKRFVAEDDPEISHAELGTLYATVAGAYTSSLTPDNYLDTTLRPFWMRLLEASASTSKGRLEIVFRIANGACNRSAKSFTNVDRTCD